MSAGAVLTHCSSAFSLRPISTKLRMTSDRVDSLARRRFMACRSRSSRAVTKNGVSAAFDGSDSGLLSLIFRADPCEYRGNRWAPGSTFASEPLARRTVLSDRFACRSLSLPAQRRERRFACWWIERAAAPRPMPSPFQLAGGWLRRVKACLAGFRPTGLFLLELPGQPETPSLV